MKLKIKIKMLSDITRPEIIDKGDWIDLRCATDVVLPSPISLKARKDNDRKVMFYNGLIPLGVAMELPKGFEAVVNPRSSLFLKYNVMLANSQGVIDNSYNGDKDEWKAHLVVFGDTKIMKNERILQFRIQPSQKATVWQKLKWLLTNGVKLVFVDELGHPDRGGHGTTGVK